MTPVKNLLGEGKKIRGESPTLKEKSSIPKNGCSKAVGGWLVLGSSPPPFAQGNDTTRTEPLPTPTHQPTSLFLIPFHPNQIAISPSLFLLFAPQPCPFVVFRRLGEPKMEHFFNFPRFFPSGLPLWLANGNILP